METLTDTYGQLRGGVYMWTSGCYIVVNSWVLKYFSCFSIDNVAFQKEFSMIENDAGTCYIFTFTPNKRDLKPKRRRLLGDRSS